MFFFPVNRLVGKSTIDGRVYSSEYVRRFSALLPEGTYRHDLRRLMLFLPVCVESVAYLCGYMTFAWVKLPKLPPPRMSSHSTPPLSTFPSNIVRTCSSFSREKSQKKVIY